MEWLNPVLTIISLIIFWIAGYDTSDFAMEFSLFNRSWMNRKRQLLAFIPVVLQVLLVVYGFK